MPTLADIQTATPKCPKGEIANIPGQLCGEPMRWRHGHWECTVHGHQLSGPHAAVRSGYATPGTDDPEMDAA